MLAGGLVFLFPLSLSLQARKILFYVALITLLLSIILLTDNLLWPGYWATIPVISTMAIIAANQDNLIMRNPAFQYLGKISYSVYLWHWPIVVLLSTAALLSNPFYIVSGIFTSLIL